jgi:Arc/MetJ-type ribon-helix-helix transcriptional regulator
MTQMIRKHVLLPLPLNERIKLVARKDHKSEAEVIRELLAEGLKQEAARTNAADVLLHIAQGAVKNLPPDVSVNIDEYLYETNE